MAANVDAVTYDAHGCCGLDIVIIWDGAGDFLGARPYPWKVEAAELLAIWLGILLAREHDLLPFLR